MHNTVRSPLHETMKRFLENTVLRTTLLYAGLIVVPLIVLILVQNDTEKRLESLQLLRVKRDQESQAIQSLTELKNQASTARLYASALRALLPNEDGVLGVQRSLRDLARTHNLTFTFSFSGTQEPTETELGSIGFQLTTSGTVDDVTAFLDEVRAMPSLVAIESAELVFGTNSSINASLQGKIFFK